MAFLHSFAVGDFLDSLVSLFAAFVLGALIGAERQYRQRGGGLRAMPLFRSARRPSLTLGCISTAIPARSVTWLQAPEAGIENDTGEELALVGRPARMLAHGIQSP
jgi:hypothetical protein